MTLYYRELFAAAIIKAIDPKPIRLYSSRWKKFYLSKMMDAYLSPKHFSSILNSIGKNISLWKKVFSHLIQKGDFLLYDLTTIFTYSKNLILVEKGCNAHHEYLDQIGIVIAFSTSDSLPVAIEVFFGSLKDITSFYDFRKRYPDADIGFVFDRGFSSYELLEDFREDGIHYIVPLRKDSQYIDLRWLRWRSAFHYRKRSIRWGKKSVNWAISIILRIQRLEVKKKVHFLKR